VVDKIRDLTIRRLGGDLTRGISIQHHNPNTKANKDQEEALNPPIGRSNVMDANI
jgi:hypothetical protein